MRWFYDCDVRPEITPQWISRVCNFLECPDRVSRRNKWRGPKVEHCKVRFCGDYEERILQFGAVLIQCCGTYFIN
jgi:hypothetical protein